MRTKKSAKLKQRAGGPRPVPISDELLDWLVRACERRLAVEARMDRSAAGKAESDRPTAGDTDGRSR
jgi:hypothetical protein